jgi:hypothetical protein
MRHATAVGAGQAPGTGDILRGKEADQTLPYLPCFFNFGIAVVGMISRC